MATQQEIDDLLNDDWDDSSRITAPKKSIVKEQNPVPQPKSQVHEESYSYANDDFEEYEESRRTQSYQQSQSESQPKKPAVVKSKQKQHLVSKQLTEIKEEPAKKKEPIKQVNQNYIKPALDLKSESAITRKNKNSTMAYDKAYLPHNYARLQEREKELLLTTLTEENKKLKTDIIEKDNSYRKLEQKYKMLLEEKTQNTSTTKELALEKQVSSLKTRLEQLTNLNKIAQDREKYKTKIGKSQTSFVPEEEVSRREQELLDLIDKLKRRLIESDESLGVLQKKVNQGVEYNDELHRKMKRVEQLEYKIEKMTEQAETDRGYIDILKDKVKQLEKQVDEEKDKFRKLEIEMKRAQMSQLTHSDLVKELQEVRREKQLLQKSLKDMSSTMMGKVVSNYQRIPGNRIEDSGELLNPSGKG